MAGKREVVPMKEGETKIIRKVTQSRLGDVIKEVVVVEEHKCANGKITITTTTTTTTKKASDAVEVPVIKPEPLITAQVTTTPEAVSVEANTQSATVTETVASTTQTTATSTQETPTLTATVTESTTEATTTTTGTPTATTTVTETITSNTAIVSPPVAATPVVTTTVTETITSDTAVVSPPAAATPVVTTTVTETITSDTAVVSPPVSATPVVTTTVTETITSDTAAVSPPVAATPVAATPVVTTTITETITSNATTVPPPPPAPVVTTTVTETITSAASATETTTETTEETTEETPEEPEKEQPPYFEISQSRGKKRAVIIGINYLNGGGQLSGCINDALNIKKFLMNFYGFRETDIVLLTDDSEDPFRMPTNHNIRKAMGEMCRDSQLNDSFFFHYSGHGGSVDDDNGDEVDGKDETICPSDYQYEGQIIDDDMYDLMVRPLCAGSRLTAVFDSCHSGTALDLPYVYSPDGDIKSKSLIRQAGEGLLGISTNHKGGAMNLISSFMSLGQEMIKTRQIETHNRELNTSPADVIMFSGCDDHEYSKDANVSNEATGAMSYALIRALSENPDQTYQELLKNVRKMTVLKYDQTPQMSSSHPIDLNKKFVC
ncbi:caspase domain-containing protein [Phycomyces nitens]|nr:caspase domain-containing protein [Phycomyces nitens]